MKNTCAQGLAIGVLVAAFVLLPPRAHAGGLPARDAAATDPVPDAAHPTTNKQLLVPSGGVGMNALFLLASGEARKPTLVLLHGLPGNERNLDLAQAVRRAGWNVLTFTYRGAWGSPGKFSIANSIEDANAAVDYLRRPEVAEKYRVDPARIVLGGHSMGAFAAAQVGAARDDLQGLLLLDPWNVGMEAQPARGDARKRAELVAGFDDLGNSLVGASAQSLAEEVVGSPESWDLRTLAPRLAKRPLLLLWADRGIAEQNQALAASLTQAGASRLTTAHLPTDHAFSDHRITLSRAVVAWLQALDGASCSPSDAADRELVLAFYRRALVERQPREAFERYMSEDFVEHKPDIAKGSREETIRFLAGIIKDVPEARWEIVRAAAQDGLVFVHARFAPAPGTPDYALADVFRVENCRIVEHWDVVGPPSKEASPNPNPRF